MIRRPARPQTRRGSPVRSLRRIKAAGNRASSLRHDRDVERVVPDARRRREVHLREMLLSSCRLDSAEVDLRTVGPAEFGEEPGHFGLRYRVVRWRLRRRPSVVSAASLWRPRGPDTFAISPGLTSMMRVAATFPRISSGWPARRRTMRPQQPVRLARERVTHLTGRYSPLRASPADAAHRNFEKGQPGRNGQARRSSRSRQACRPHGKTRLWDRRATASEAQRLQENGGMVVEPVTCEPVSEDWPFPVRQENTGNRTVVEMKVASAAFSSP